MYIYRQGRDDTHPYLTSTSVILRLYNTSTYILIIMTLLMAYFNKNPISKIVIHGVIYICLL